MSRASISRVCVALAVLLLVPACRSAAPASSSDLQLSPSPAESTVRPTADVLSLAEIRTAHVNDAYEAVVRFRPEFLKRRSLTAHTDPNGGLPVVYVNGVRQGGTELLRSIPAGVVVEIRYLSANAASHQFGPYHAGGVLAVRTNP